VALLRIQAGHKVRLLNGTSVGPLLPNVAVTLTHVDTAAVRALQERCARALSLLITLSLNTDTYTKVMEDPGT